MTKLLKSLTLDTFVTVVEPGELKPPNTFVKFPKITVIRGRAAPGCQHPLAWEIPDAIAIKVPTIINKYFE